MGRVYSDIYKSKLPRGLCYPLHYQDLEELFTGRTEKDAYLAVGFWWRRTRRQEAAEGRHRLFEAQSPPVSIYWMSRRFPNHDLSDAIIASADVSPVPRPLLMETGLRRPILRAFVAEQLDRLAQGGLFANRWELRVDLLADTGELEAVRKRWTGLREEPAERSVLVLEPVTAQRLS